MRALIMVLTSSVPSPTYALCEIFPFQACAEVGGPTQTALLNRKMRARLWDELRPGGRYRGQDPKTALSWPEPCDGTASWAHGPASTRSSRTPTLYLREGKVKTVPRSVTDAGE